MKVSNNGPVITGNFQEIIRRTNLFGYVRPGLIKKHYEHELSPQIKYKICVLRKDDFDYYF